MRPHLACAWTWLLKRQLKMRAKSDGRVQGERVLLDGFNVHHESHLYRLLATPELQRSNCDRTEGRDERLQVKTCCQQDLYGRQASFMVKKSTSRKRRVTHRLLEDDNIPCHAVSGTSLRAKLGHLKLNVWRQRCAYRLLLLTSWPPESSSSGENVNVEGFLSGC